MSRKKYPFRLTKKEEGWVIFFCVLVLGFIGWFTYNFFSNCVFELPIQWDIITCWKEQIEPSERKAVEGAVDFMPTIKIRY
jgi:hypothetical protein